MSRPTALGAYIFSGGFSLGVQDHFDIIGHLEDGPYGVETAREAQRQGFFKKPFPIFHDAGRWPWERYVDEVDFLYGNPPCAAWSPLGPRAQRGIDSWKSDDRVDCTRGHFNLWELIRPRVWAWESVPQAYSQGRPLVDYLTKRAVSRGYAVDYVLHNAMNLGAYQSRRRFFMVVTDVDIDWNCPFTPCPTAHEALAEYAKKEAKTAALEKVGFPPDQYYTKEFIRMCKAGKALRDPYEAYLAKLMKRRPNITERERKKLAPRPSFGDRRAPRDQAMHAVVDTMILHPTEDRYLTLGELAFLGGWPTSYPLLGSNVDQKGRLLTRAVLPPVGRWLAGEVARGISGNRAAPPGRVREVNFYKEPGHITELQ